MQNNMHTCSRKDLQPGRTSGAGNEQTPAGGPVMSPIWGVYHHPPTERPFRGPRTDVLGVQQRRMHICSSNEMKENNIIFFLNRRSIGPLRRSMRTKVSAPLLQLRATLSETHSRLPHPGFYVRKRVVFRWHFFSSTRLSWWINLHSGSRTVSPHHALRVAVPHRILREQNANKILGMIWKTTYLTYGAVHAEVTDICINICLKYTDRLNIKLMLIIVWGENGQGEKSPCRF